MALTEAEFTKLDACPRPAYSAVDGKQEGLVASCLAL